MAEKLLDRVRAEVARRNLSAVELSLMSGLSYWRVTHTLAGRSAHPGVIARLAHVLGVAAP